MKLNCFVVLLLAGYVFGAGVTNIIRNVRVVGYIDYMTNVITDTVQQIEKKGWWNLKVPDTTVDVDELALDYHVKGKVHYKNGFVASIQRVDILQSSVNAQVRLNTPTQAQAVIRGNLRMHDVAIGYDVDAELEKGARQYTVTYVYPMITFAYNISKIIDHEDITLVLDVTVQEGRNTPRFLPMDQSTDIFTTLFNPAISTPGIIAWGPDVFRPIITDIISKVGFPTLCYNCAFS